ncbi:Pkinase-domain-containing protein [Lophiostoma macrostomum CBS 122681]|uniref:non-specific serine/threonine protein kinase n=1 Tax=Lophiostoma macrostomum CBS 122681 TaxID=1314788 RepID=A0A6A6T5W1_9PLEO|nr:Pkinase-domain-containing protein [Lophiostoma macrostomum CBS 122681]
MDHASHERPRRRPLGDATLRANEDTNAQRRRAEKLSVPHPASSSPNSIPHNESLVPNGTLAVRHAPQPSPENKRLSAVIHDQPRPHNTKRDSEISNASTNASGTGRRRKTHIGPWLLGKTIGRGGCSRVRLVRHSGTGEYGAAKIISKAMADQVRALSLANLVESAEVDETLAGNKVIPFGLEREICIMKLLDHKNIVRLHDIWENRNELYLIMEYVEGGELFQYIGDRGVLSEIEAVLFFRQIIAALLYCHRLNIHHRDLKPENILLDRHTLTLKLVDFGMAALQPIGKELTTPCGSPHYAAPEVIRTASYDGAKADIWSCGVILFVMLTGSPPFNYSGDDSELKYLFRAIARAAYIMPDDLSREAQDLIRRILVPDPRRRISIEEIWKHPFLHKYDSELGFQGEKATMEYWVGPMPSISHWEPLDRKTIDREILRYLRTLWHSEQEDVLVNRLLCKEANQEKYFYSALLKYRNDQLEDYSPGPHTVAYSSSDHHHHVRYSPTSQDLLELPTYQHNRSQSGYSILNNEHLYSKHSFYGPPSSDVSYDPFRASRDPIIPASSINQNVTVLRGSDSGSRRVRPATALGHHTGSSLRIQAMTNSNRQSSVRSRNSSKRSTPSTRSQRSATAQRRSMSRSSMTSSVWPSSPPVVVRPGTLGKRGVSFSHLKRSSIASAFTTSTSGPRYTPEQRKFLSRARDSVGTSVLSSPRPAMLGTPATRAVPLVPPSPKVPRLRVRNPDSPSKYIQSEARKVSTELEKVMEEAFNRSSVSSSVRTTTTERNKHVSEFDTPPTSFSNTRDSAGSTMGTPYAAGSVPQRPLPPVPDETPNTFLQRKLAETRAEIVQRLGKEGDNTEHFNEVLDHLDRLMVPTANGAKRTASAPTKSPEHAALLPVISEEARADLEDRREHYSPVCRAVTDPIRPDLQGRRAMTEQSITIRLVDQSPTPIPIAPLNIRKRSGASTVSRGANDGDAVSVRPYQGVRQELLAARTNDTTASSAAPIGLSEKKEEGTIKKKKSLWFRRTPEEKEQQQQENLSKPYTGTLQIPEAWQGLDDRIDRGPRVSPRKARSALPQHAAKDSNDSNSTEFPMRNCGTASGKSENTKERKGFFGLFGKKTKDDKGKRPMEIGSANFSSSSISAYDLAEETPGSPVHGPEVHTNWLSRFLHIKPATGVLCFQIGRGKVRQDLVRLLRDWQRFGVRDVNFDRDSNIINARIDKNNHLKIKPVSFVIELFVVLEHGRRASLCIARFTQTKGAASSFRKVIDIIDDVCRARCILVEDQEKKDAMCEVLA